MPTCRATKLCRTISSRRCGQQSSTPRCPGPMFYKSSACWPAGFEESKRGHLGEGTRATIPHLSNSEQYELLSGNRGIIKKILQSLGKVPIHLALLPVEPADMPGELMQLGFGKDVQPAHFSKGQTCKHWPGRGHFVPRTLWQLQRLSLGCKDCRLRRLCVPMTWARKRELQLVLFRRSSCSCSSRRLWRPKART